MVFGEPRVAEGPGEEDTRGAAGAGQLVEEQELPRALHSRLQERAETLALLLPCHKRTGGCGAQEAALRRAVIGTGTGAQSQRRALEDGTMCRGELEGLGQLAYGVGPRAG